MNTHFALVTILLFMFTKSLIAQNVIDYSAAINYNYNGEKVYAANSNNDAELYEKSINEMILLSTRYGIDTLSEIQKTEMAFIAHLCPFAAGPAVYKARTLYTLLYPMAQYNDRLMCVQNMGQNKNGQTGYVNLDSLYEAEGDKLGAVLIATHEQNNLANAFIKKDNTNNSTDDVVKVYPYPATTTVIIAYRKEVDGVFKLYNTLGEVVLKTGLSKENT